VIPIALTHTLPLVATAYDRFITVNFYLWSWGIQGLLCAWIGFMVAHKTSRSVFNWIFAGLLCGIIPSPIGLALMVFAYFTYPLASPEYMSRRIFGSRRRAPRSERDEAIRRDERRRRGMDGRRK
jgi:hypothetical protein